MLKPTDVLLSDHKTPIDEARAWYVLFVHGDQVYDWATGLSIDYVELGREFCFKGIVRKTYEFWLNVVNVES